MKVHRLTVDPRRVRAGLSAVGETGIPGVTVECVDIGKNTNGEGATLGKEALIQYVKDKLGSYKAPKSIAFVAQLPLSPVGKLLRRQVREKYWTNSDRKIG